MGCHLSRGAPIGVGPPSVTLSSAVDAACAKWQSLDADPMLDKLDLLRRGDEVLCLSRGGELADELRRSVDGVGRSDALAASPNDNGEGAKLRDLAWLLSTDASLASRARVPLLPFVRTAADTYITDTVGAVAARLARNGFVAHPTGHSLVMVGPRGAGKSHALRRAAVTLGLRHRNLRVVYISAKDVSRVGHPLNVPGGLEQALLAMGLRADRGDASAGASQTPTSLSGASTPLHSPAHAASGGSARLVPAAETAPAAAEVPASTLHAARGSTREHPPPAQDAGAGVASIGADSSRDAAAAQSLFEHLEAHGLRLLLLLDELEGLYQTNTDASMATVAYLASLVESSAGLTAVVAVSSSSLTYPLMRGGDLPAAEAVYARMFPTLARPLPDMNGQKLQLRRIPVASPVDPAAVLPFCVSGLSDAAHRVVMFALGSHVRSMYHGTLPHRVVAPLADVVSRASSSRKGLVRDYFEAEPGAVQLLAALYDEAAAINGQLLARVLDRGVPPDAPLLDRIDTAAVEAIDWAAEFKPVPAGRVIALARGLWPTDIHTRNKLGNYLWFLHADAAFITVIQGDGREDLERYPIFPSSPLSLLLHVQWSADHRFTAKANSVPAARDASSGLMASAATASSWKALLGELRGFPGALSESAAIVRVADAPAK